MDARSNRWLAVRRSRRPTPERQHRTPATRLIPPRQNGISVAPPRHSDIRARDCSKLRLSAGFFVADRWVDFAGERIGLGSAIGRV